jgi:hypothetical protein
VTDLKQEIYDAVTNHVERHIADLSYAPEVSSDTSTLVAGNIRHAIREMIPVLFYQFSMWSAQRRFSVCEADPRMFIRELRGLEPDEHGYHKEPFYLVTEGRAVELLTERERRAFERGKESRIAALEADNARLREATLDTLASLTASLSLLKGGGRTAAPSEKMFKIMLMDYQRSVDRARTTLENSQ